MIEYFLYGFLVWMIMGYFGLAQYLGIVLLPNESLNGYLKREYGSHFVLPFYVKIILFVTVSLMGAITIYLNWRDYKRGILTKFWVMPRWTL